VFAGKSLHVVWTSQVITTKIFFLTLFFHSKYIVTIKLVRLCITVGIWSITTTPNNNSFYSGWGMEAAILTAAASTTTCIPPAPSTFAMCYPLSSMLSTGHAPRYNLLIKKKHRLTARANHGSWLKIIRNEVYNKFCYLLDKVITVTSFDLVLSPPLLNEETEKEYWVNGTKSLSVNVSWFKVVKRLLFLNTL